ncbi:MAG: hypothetical protein M3Y06_05170 [Actinomycetota bacterium]|nr:hypothetical protein [Actinomycetota bacterium]
MTTTAATPGMSQPARVLLLPVLPWVLWRALLVAGAAVLTAVVVALLVLAVVGITDLPSDPGPVPTPRPAGF